MNELTQQGIQALRAGDRANGRRLLASAIRQDPRDVSAWLWLTGALDSDEERLACLRQVLRIDPQNAAALRGLQQLEARMGAAAAAPVDQAAAPVDQTAAPEEPAELVAADASAGSEPAPAADVIPLPAPASARQDFAEASATLLEDQPAAAVEEREMPTADAQARASRRDTMESAAPTAPPEGRRRGKTGEGAQVIFRARPSVVPALAAFWIFLVGAIVVGLLLRDDLVLALSLAIGLGVVLELIVLYAALRTLAVRYELTNQQLTLRYRGKRVRIPLGEIQEVSCRQSTFQRLLGTGDVRIQARVNGELARLKMRNIAECERRAAQIRKQAGL